MGVFDIIKASFSYASYDFFRLKEEVLSLVKIGRKSGLSIPDYCCINIKKPSKGIDYPIKIDLYYKADDQEVMHLPKSFIVGSFKTIPVFVKESLDNNGSVDIRIDNLLELTLSANEPVMPPIKFDSIVGFMPKSAYKSRRVIIKDDLFNFKVVYSFLSPNDDLTSNSVLYANIIGLPSDIINRIKEDGECSLDIG